MQIDAAPMSILLPRAAPVMAEQRLLLYGLRRMGAHGLNDAHAAGVLLGRFGRSHRRPLILLRAFMAETSRAARRTIRIAACCCGRMTRDEVLLLDAVIQSLNDPRSAHQLLARCLGTADCIGALTSAQALNQAFVDLGSPL